MANVTLSTLIDKFLQETLSDAEDKELIREMLDLGTQAEPEFVNVTVKQILGIGGTITASTPLLDLAQTWNSSGVTFTALKLNVTNTASASASLLLDLQVGGTSQFRVRRDGVFFCNGQENAGYTSWSFGACAASPNSSGAFAVGSNSGYDFVSTSTNAFVAPDTFLRGPAPATVQLGKNHATTGTTQTIKSHNVTTGTGANLNIYAGSGSSGKGLLTFDGSNRTEVSSFSIEELYSVLLKFGILSPLRNSLEELTSPSTGQIYIAFSSGNSIGLQWAIVVQYSTDESNWQETATLETGDGNSTSLTIDSLDAETTYYVRWRSRAYYNENVFSEWSSTQSITTSL